MRRAAMVVAGTLAAGLLAWPVVSGAQGAAKVTITSPREGSTVTGPKVDVKLKIENFTTVDAGSPVKAGEGHAHVLVDREPKAGEVLPTTDPSVVHFGKAPYDARSIDLTPGKHTLIAVLGDSSHKVLEPVVSHRVTITVRAAGAAAPPGKAADTGDGSLASGGLATGAIVALGLALLALATRMAVRRA